MLKVHYITMSEYYVEMKHRIPQVYRPDVNFARLHSPFFRCKSPVRLECTILVGYTVIYILIRML